MGHHSNVDHALICKCGGFIAIRHNDIRDFTANVLTEVCRDVTKEPLLQPLTGEKFDNKSTITEDDARVDISARRFWVRGQVAFLDVRAFSPLATSNNNKSLESIHRQHEKEKKRKYNQRILHVERGSFTPLVFSCVGGMSIETRRFYNRLADLIAEKRNIRKGEASCWLKTRLNFCLIRSMVLCLRGTRASKNFCKDWNDTNDIKFANRISNVQDGQPWDG